MIDIIMEKNQTFFTGVKPPKITDVKKYNKAVLWNINQKYLYDNATPIEFSIEELEEIRKKL